MDQRSEEGLRFQREFFRNRSELHQLTELFDHIPANCFFAKDRDSRFVRMNARNCELYGLTEESQILGRTDRDFHPPALAEAYIAEDERVMGTGKAIHDQTWLVPYIDGRLQWYVCTKIPLRDRDQQIVGLAGVMYPIATPEEETARFMQLAPAVRFLDANFEQQVQFSEIAKMCSLSQTHFNRLFKQLLRMSPTQYRTALRVQKARVLLRSSAKMSTLDIALAAGFFDQSHMTKHFTKAVGMTPTQYRKRFIKPS